MRSANPSLPVAATTTTHRKACATSLAQLQALRRCRETPRHEQLSRRDPLEEAEAAAGAVGRHDGRTAPSTRTDERAADEWEHGEHFAASLAAASERRKSMAAISARRSARPEVLVADDLTAATLTGTASFRLSQ